MFISCLAVKFKMQVLWMNNLLQMHWGLCCTKTPAMAGSEASKKSIVLIGMEKLNKTRFVYSVNCVTMNRWEWEVYKRNWTCTECQCILSDLHVAYWLLVGGCLQLPQAICKSYHTVLAASSQKCKSLDFHLPSLPLTQYVKEQLLRFVPGVWRIVLALKNLHKRLHTETHTS